MVLQSIPSHSHTVDVHTPIDKFMEVQGACQYSQDVLSVCLKKALGGPQFSQLGVMTGLWVWLGLYVLKGIWCDGNKCVLFLSVLIRHPFFLLTLLCFCLHIEWNAFCEVFT